MASISLPARGESGHLRPLNILHDLPRVADLIELCFASNMDSEGRSYVHEMRRASNDHSFLKWASLTLEGASMPLAGVVWEQEGHIVGNVSLILFRRKGLRYFLIANVATHPNYRRRGIARALTKQAIQTARQRGADQIWLHVRADNVSAIKIYTELGFEERARRTLWRVPFDSPLPPSQNHAPGLPAITRRDPRFWPQQSAWLRRLHPEELAWYRAWDWNILRPGLWNWLYRLFVEFDLRQWAALTGDRLQAALAWTPSYRNDLLWLACGPESDPAAVTSLLRHARRELGYRRSLWLEHPAGVQDDAIYAAGFFPHRTLIWMRAPSATHENMLRT
ncbi:MAG: hypothetical protein Fur0043_13400 [Anaerolineales bacterium]